MMSYWYSLRSDSKQEVCWLAVAVIILLCFYPVLAQKIICNGITEADNCLAPYHQRARIKIWEKKTSFLSTIYSFMFNKDNPIFSLSEKTSFIDAKIHPQGYIIAESSDTIQNKATSDVRGGFGSPAKIVEITLQNLPITATIKIYIEFVDMESSDWDLFEIFTTKQLVNDEPSNFTQTKIFSTVESERDEERSFSGNSTLTFRYQPKSRHHQRYSMRLNYTVESCDEDIPMLRSLRQTYKNSSDYEVICEDKSPNTEGTTFSCHNNQWSSEIDCTRSQSGLSTTKQATTANSAGQMDYSLLAQVSIGLSVLLMIVVVAMVIQRMSQINSKKVIQSQRRPRPLPELPNNGAIDNESDLDTDTGYESIGTTDPYLDYTTINQNKTLSNYQNNIIKESSNSQTEDCNWHDLQKSRSEPPSIDLYDMIVEEMRKKGIELHNTELPEISRNQIETTNDHVYENWGNSTRDLQPENSETIDNYNSGETISNSHHNLQSTERQQGQEVNPEIGCYDDDAESVYEMYTIKDNVKTVFKS